MAARRFVAQADVDRWESMLRDAADAALADMRTLANRALASRGLRRAALTAATSKRTGVATAAGAGAGLVLWSDPAWRKATAKHVVPVTNSVAKDAVVTARQAVPATHTWGMDATSTSTGISTALVVGVAAAGTYLGARLLDKLASSSDPEQDAEDVFSTADAIIGGQLGAAAQMAGNFATSEVASYLGNYMSADYGLSLKTWNAVGDDKTRDDHAEADGQEVGINEYFDVGGESLMYPGDSDGSDWNTINCRCWVTVDTLGGDESPDAADVEGEAGEGA